MSYCRWSSDNFMCDVYIYDDCNGGTTLHVASRRRSKPAPDTLTPLLEHNKKLLEERQKEWEAWSKEDDANWTILPEPYAGESYNFETHQEVIDKLLELRKAGFLVPQYAIDDLAAEEDNANSD